MTKLAHRGHRGTTTLTFYKEYEWGIDVISFDLGGLATAFLTDYKNGMTFPELFDKYEILNTTNNQQPGYEFTSQVSNKEYDYIFFIEELCEFDPILEVKHNGYNSPLKYLTR